MNTIEVKNAQRHIRMIYEEILELQENLIAIEQQMKEQIKKDNA